MLPYTTGETTGNVDARFICVSKKGTLSRAALLVPVDKRAGALVLGYQAKQIVCDNCHVVQVFLVQFYAKAG